ncbi:hypothetical protein K491DRAFT_119678 [Lophiostoma macrostomum CBS 122681]|uniref:Uncharacterized protein n=1 Tax=Lophiostoma macrostomum CBS 122681 TaxID=1314788 RepID=A0A6A6SUQ3_9PLEO|nr:hypothetical protein K491DRAFT_119678 [Lophiostoma macrostomum CBS 122681]
MWYMNTSWKHKSRIRCQTPRFWPQPWHLHSSQSAAVTPTYPAPETHLQFLRTFLKQADQPHMLHKFGPSPVRWQN